MAHISSVKRVRKGSRRRVHRSLEKRIRDLSNPNVQSINIVDESFHSQSIIRSIQQNNTYPENHSNAVLQITDRKQLKQESFSELSMKRINAATDAESMNHHASLSQTPPLPQRRQVQQLPRRQLQQLPRRQLQQLPRRQLQQLPRQQLQQLPRRQLQQLPRQQLQPLPRRQVQRLPRRQLQQLPRRQPQQLPRRPSLR
ncbi:unnamed protein product [Rotaria sp. Silwood1]|nr:unnamed protein product [Rotaria sp. Silwood1]